jgi:hypothetical protein
VEGKFSNSKYVSSVQSSKRTLPKPAVGQKSGAPNVPTHRHRTHSAASGAPDLTTCLAGSKINGRSSEHRTHLTPSTQRPTPSVRCTPVSSPSSETRIGRVRRITIGRATVPFALQLFCHAPRQQALDAKQCSASVRCKTVRRAGAATQLCST